MGEVVRIVGNLPDLSEQQIIGAFEFFRVNPDAVPIFLTMQERYKSGYIRSVDCVGAIDGTHIPCIVAVNLQAAYRNRKGFTSQNILVIVDFDMKFTYIVAGWEGSVHDARVLRDVLNDPAFSFPKPPRDKYFLVDSRYANRRGFLAPYRGTNYHLCDRRRVGGDHKKELFNYRHASLRNAVERTFRIWKSRFRILKGVRTIHFGRRGI
ncbi:hypothetical protein UlMin_013727 [Ulmus minor]